MLANVTAAIAEELKLLPCLAVGAGELEEQDVQVAVERKKGRTPLMLLGSHHLLVYFISASLSITFDARHQGAKERKPLYAYS